MAPPRSSTLKRFSPDSTAFVPTRYPTTVFIVLLCRTPTPSEGQDEADANERDENVGSYPGQYARAKSVLGEQPVSANERDDTEREPEQNTGDETGRVTCIQHSAAEMKRCVDGNDCGQRDYQRRSGRTSEDQHRSRRHKHPEECVGAKKRSLGNCETGDFCEARRKAAPVLLGNMGKVGHREQEDPRPDKGLRSRVSGVEHGLISRRAALYVGRPVNLRR